MFSRKSRLLAAVFLLHATLALAADDPADEPVVRAVGKVLPAVVNINTERIVRHSVHDPRDVFFNEFFGGPIRPPRELRQKVPSLGSGFIVDPAGYIVTNEHVVERAADLKIQVTTQDGKSYEARYVAGDAESDLAFIKVDAEEPLPFIDIGELSPGMLGQTVIVLGNPLGYGSSVSRGILSAIDRTVTVADAEYANLIQTDAAINPGNSGGPIIDISGRLVGVASVKMAYTPQGVPTQGIGFGIPADRVREKVAEFKVIAERGPVAVVALSPEARRGFGLHLQDLTEDLAAAMGLERRGVLVSDVEEESPAAAAGWRRGLVIYRVGRYEVNSVLETEALLRRARTGVTVDFLIGIANAKSVRGAPGVQTVSLQAR